MAQRYQHTRGRRQSRLRAHEGNCELAMLPAHCPAPLAGLPAPGTLPVCVPEPLGRPIPCVTLQREPPLKDVVALRAAEPSEAGGGGAPAVLRRAGVRAPGPPRRAGAAG